MKEIRATDPVTKEKLEYWKEINFVDKVSSDIAFQEQVLWFNSLIRIDNEHYFFKEWFEISISKVKNLQSGNDNFLTLKDFASKHDLRVRPFSFYGLLSRICKNITDTAEILWRKVRCTKSTKLIEFQFILIHRRIPTNDF